LEAAKIRGVAHLQHGGSDNISKNSLANARGVMQSLATTTPSGALGGRAKFLGNTYGWGLLAIIESIALQRTAGSLK
jgi:hypothetical protein